MLWGLFKRAIISVYNHVSAKRRQAYLNGLVFRFNHRHDENLFDLVLASA